MAAQEQPRVVTPPAAPAHPTSTNVNVSSRPHLRAVPPPPATVVPAGTVVARRAVSSAAYAVAKANQILWFVCGVLELLLGMRVVLRMMGANAAAGFVRFIYGVTQPLAAPFLGMLPNAAGATRAAVLEVPTLIAMVVYFLLFLMITLLLRLLISRPAEL